MSCATDRELPTGTAPCGHCGLQVGADDPLIGSWSASGKVLTTAWHRGPTGCLLAMGKRINELEASSERRLP